MPDFAIYDQEYGHNAWELPESVIKSSTVADERKIYLAKASFAWLICPMKMEHRFLDGRSDHNGDDDDELTYPCGDKDSHDQIQRDVAEIFLHQHREFVFSVLLGRKNARLMRWDRCGTVVSDTFNYIEDSAPLLNFIYRQIGRAHV